MDWFRWHHGTVTDPKFRLIARLAGQPLTTVLAVWATILERASQAETRGSLDGWDHEAVAVGLDIQAGDVVAIFRAMNGRMLDGDANGDAGDAWNVTSWKKRQPKREDDSAERTREWRARKREPLAVGVTHGDADVTHGDSRGEERRGEVKKKPTVSKKATWRFCPEDFQPDEKHRLLARQLTVNLDVELAKFRDHEFAKPKSDPSRAFATWLRNANEFKRKGIGTAKESRVDWTEPNDPRTLSPFKRKSYEGDYPPVEDRPVSETWWKPQGARDTA